MINKEHYSFVENIQKLLAAYSNNSTALVKHRFEKLNEIYNHYKYSGFPKALTQYKLSLIPSHFQESIYDGINWEKQDSDLRHMKDIFEIDCIFQNEGKSRNELSKTEFANYIQYCDEIIEKATSR